MAEIHPMKTAAETALAEAFARRAKALARRPTRRGPCATRPSRPFVDAGLPHRRVEDWKYTDLRALMREARPLAPAPDARRARQGAPSVRGAGATTPICRLTLVDGSFAPSLSDVGLTAGGRRVLSAGARLSPMATRSSSICPGTARAGQCRALQLNAAFMTDGVILAVDAGVAVHLPVLLQTSSTTGAAGTATYTRSSIVLGEGASMTLVDTL